VFLTEFNYTATSKRYRSINTNIKCLEKDYVTLADLTKTYNREASEFFIEAWLYNLNDYFNTDKKLTPEQISEIAEMFYDKAYYLNLPEMVLFFKKIKMGEYGKIFGSFCGVDLFNSLNIFLDSRGVAVEKIRNKKELSTAMRIEERGLRGLAIFLRAEKENKW